MNKLLKLISNIDTNWERNSDISEIKRICEAARDKTNPLAFVSFTCSTIDATKMFNTKRFEKYVSLSPEGNNLESNISFFNSFFGQLNRDKTKYELVILIGNTDPYYIYSQQLQALPGVTEKAYFSRFEKRWSMYKKNLTRWLEEKCPGITIRVISWYEYQQALESEIGLSFTQMFNTVYPKINQYFEKSVFDMEVERLQDAFGENKYFGALSRPPRKKLRDWVQRKFTEYALQGLWIKIFWPDCILIQNEKPALLRYEMYQPLIREYLNTTLANIFPFGIEDGYS